MSLSEKIRKIRKAKKLSQQQIADHLGIHRVQYTRIENDKTDISVSTLQRLAQFFEIEIGDFFQEDVSHELSVHDKTVVEKLRLIEQLDEQQRTCIYTLIETAINYQRLKYSLSNALKLSP